MNTLEIKNLNVFINDKQILNNFNIVINEGEIHVIIGPNGTGKSTLAKVIMGDKTYQVKSGEILYNGVRLNELQVDERARLGIFLGMQYPLEINEITNSDFLRTVLNKKDGNKSNSTLFIKKLNKEIENLKIDKDIINREINYGLTISERKKNEILQMKMLKPNLVLLDEIDSELDLNALKIISENIIDYFNQFKPGMLLITHCQKLLDYITPTHVHIMKSGSIIKTGDLSLISLIKKEGYDSIEKGNSDE